MIINIVVALVAILGVLATRYHYKKKFASLVRSHRPDPTLEFRKSFDPEWYEGTVYGKRQRGRETITDQKADH